MSLTEYNEELFGYNTLNKNGLAGNANYIKAVLPPIGAIFPWLKTFGTADSGTTNGVTASKLMDSTQNFITTCKVGYVVKNTTDSTYTYITAIDSDTQLSLAADIFTSGEGYVIYKTAHLPYGYAECNGATISDADSPYNGETLPDLNSGYILKGGTASGATAEIASGTGVNTYATVFIIRYK